MLYYPINPDKSFVKRVIAEEGDHVRIVDGRVYVNDVPMADDFVPPEYRSHDDRRSDHRQGRLLLRAGRPSEQQLRQPPLGRGAEEVHHRQGPAALVAVPERAGFLTVMSDYPETPRDDVAAPPSDTEPQLVAETPSLPDGRRRGWRMAVGNQQDAAIPFPEPDAVDAGPPPLVFEPSGLAPPLAGDVEHGILDR